jgi:hypothetical protein
VLDKCANPACSAKFLRLHDGRLFVTEVEGHDQSDTKRYEHQLQYSWLCSSCCRTGTVAIEKGKRPQVVPLPESAAAAS